MKSIATALALFISTAPALADNSFPCSLLQLWVTSLPTVPADHNLYSAGNEVSIASIVLRKQPATELQTHVAQFSSNSN